MLILLRSKDISSMLVSPKKAPSIKNSIWLRLSRKTFRFSRPWNVRPWISTNLFLLTSSSMRDFICVNNPLGKEERKLRVRIKVSREVRLLAQPSSRNSSRLFFRFSLCRNDPPGKALEGNGFPSKAFTRLERGIVPIRFLLMKKIMLFIFYI